MAIAAARLARQVRGGRIVIQLLGLLLGADCVATVGLCTSTPMLLTAMTAFGLCKGCYDAGIFASLFDHVRPEARASAAGKCDEDLIVRFANGDDSPHERDRPAVVPAHTASRVWAARDRG